MKCKKCFFCGWVKDFSNGSSEETVEIDRTGKGRPILKWDCKTLHAQHWQKYAFMLLHAWYALAPIPVLSGLQHFLDHGSSVKISYLFLLKYCVDIRIFHCISVTELYVNGTDKKQMLSRESIGIYVRIHLYYIGEGIGSHGRKREILFKRALSQSTHISLPVMSLSVLSNISRYIVHLWIIKNRNKEIVLDISWNWD